MNSTNNNRRFNSSKQGYARIVNEMPLQFQVQMRPRAEEVVARVLSQNESLRCGVEVNSGDARADVEPQIPERRPKIRQDGNFLAAVVQVNHIDIEPALEKAAA